MTRIDARFLVLLLPLAVVAAKVGEADLKPIPFADITPDGLLKARAELAFHHLQSDYFQWASISKVNSEPFPGDAVGRVINGLSLLAQALHEPAPGNLEEILRRMNELANSDGYLGPKLPESRANEDVLAAHNGYACGLVEYALWTTNPAATASLQRVVTNLFVPARAAIACYRDSSEAAAKWQLSGGDIGQLFLALDGMTRAYELVPLPELKATIETAIARYHQLDLVGIEAQTHAMLSATTGILRWYERHRRPDDLAFAEARTLQIRVNGVLREPRVANGFGEVSVALKAGTVVEVEFEQTRGARPALHPEQAPGACRYFSGPLLLGSSTAAGEEPLTPILDLLAPGKQAGEPYVYFPNSKGTSIVSGGAPSKTPNLAKTAQCFRRDATADQLPPGVSKLFGESGYERSSAICGFLWPEPQRVTQIILQWPESVPMPKPEEVAVRWRAGKAWHEAAHPGIIGNGRQWVYTLSQTVPNAVLDSFVVSAKGNGKSSAGFGIPEVEVLGAP